MIRIFIDIENTIIDSLFDRNWMDSNIEGIKKCLKKMEDETLSVSLFTWGWTKTEEIEPELVKMIFDKLEVREDLRGDVVIKETVLMMLFMLDGCIRVIKKRHLFLE